MGRLSARFGERGPVHGSGRRGSAVGRSNGFGGGGSGPRAGGGAPGMDEGTLGRKVEGPSWRLAQLLLVDAKSFRSRSSRLGNWPSNSDGERMIDFCSARVQSAVRCCRSSSSPPPRSSARPTDAGCCRPFDPLDPFEPPLLSMPVRPRSRFGIAGGALPLRSLWSSTRPASSALRPGLPGGVLPLRLSGLRGTVGLPGACRRGLEPPVASRLSGCGGVGCGTGWAGSEWRIGRTVDEFIPADLSAAMRSASDFGGGGELDCAIGWPIRDIGPGASGCLVRARL